MAAKSDVIFLCVKPNIVQPVLKECADVMADKLVISIAAGITIETLEEVFHFRLILIVVFFKA